MCGVISLIFERDRDDLGRITAELLKALEYRGYDSTGAAVQGSTTEVVLRKGVGAPSRLVDELGIVDLAGRILCGQVRWATFGAVDQANSQPHVVSCKTALYGAHNGNVTNCDDLKLWLQSEGHQVVSDNDGEMVVHVIEQTFAELLEQDPDAPLPRRRAHMRAAIGVAATRLEGSYAAVIVDPVSQTLWAIKNGSSLYFGIGEDERGGKFAMASSDLSAVLKMTRILVPLAEGELMEFSASEYQALRIQRDGSAPIPIERQAMRSRLRAKDTALHPPHTTFMEQEIHAQEATCRDVLRIFGGGSAQSRQAAPFIDGLAPDERAMIQTLVEALLDQCTDEAIATCFAKLMNNPAFRTLLGRLPAELRAPRAADAEALADSFCSADAGFCADLLAMATSTEERIAIRLLDAYLERFELAEYSAAITQFCEHCIHTLDCSGRIYLVCCGTSFHAAKAASLFFSDLARTEVLPLLPGEFRGQYADTLRNGDLLIAVSQSGETKDLLDVVNLVIQSGRAIGRIALVNNVNSTLAQEKGALVIPLRCGPEIAVPATKSFINQLTVFYCLAVRLAERRLTTGHVIEGQAGGEELSERNLSLPALPRLIRETIEQTGPAIEEAAQLLYLRPSMHLLATRLLAVAKEGALKIREVVLNHTEGIEGSEFKHGPNTILGFNTIYGPLQLESAMRMLASAVETVVARGQQADCAPEDLPRLARLALESVFEPSLLDELDDEQRGWIDSPAIGQALRRSLEADYPLLFITGPEKRDVSLTISQINTHKIRGALPIVFAEDNTALRGAAQRPPSGTDDYRSVYIQLPETGDTLMTVFSASVALQQLALCMSVKKMAYLDGHGIHEHGVHPDVPKNVSKSITVD